ncbi:MAG TPA: 16S rRNA (guanine(966)-N(2))-methyltransferase RsmD [Candidatus Acidoferrales bacterium]|nr:16S rRNA (guanine(966)-N(2))-methyltransferase RsmD [Candidatus Acidoferrales bacterium]
MRVIAGKFKSRRLHPPRGIALRPTSDRLRETLFNILGPTVEGSLFVDVFAGTGAVGIEAISRGAEQVIFIEKNTSAAELIRENLKSLRIVGGVAVLPFEVIRGLKQLAAQRILADLIFLDPPYAQPADYLHVLEFISESHLLAPGGLLIAEHARKMELPEKLEKLERSRLVEQGDSALSFYHMTVG